MVRQVIIAAIGGALIGLALTIIVINTVAIVTAIKGDRT
jgi:hypothetical protein